MTGSFFSSTAHGLNVRVRLTPQGRAVCVDGVMNNAQGLGVLKASVTTAPEGGKANQALIKLLSKEWNVAKSTIEVLHGQTSRLKILQVVGDSDQLEKKLTLWAKAKGI